jgi:NarL family two-component system response regulator LiaR
LTVPIPDVTIPAVITVWIVARHPLLQEGLRGLLNREPDLQPAVVNASQLGDLVGRVRNEPPDVLLLDVQILEQEGWDLVAELSSVAPGAAVLVIGDTPEDRRITRALQLGARGYLLRDLAAEQMSAAIRAARSGLYVLHPAVAAEWRSGGALSAAGALDEAGDALESDLVEPLSPRELEVLRLLARGMSNKQIAAGLYITEHTVKFHIRSILGKLGAANRTEAVTLAIQKGLVAV